MSQEFYEYLRTQVPQLLFPKKFIEVMFKHMYIYSSRNMGKWIEVPGICRVKLFSSVKDGRLTMKVKFLKDFSLKFDPYSDGVVNDVLRRKQITFSDERDYFEQVKGFVIEHNDPLPVEEPIVMDLDEDDDLDSIF